MSPHKFCSYIEMHSNLGPLCDGSKGVSQHCGCCHLATDNSVHQDAIWALSDRIYTCKATTCALEHVVEKVSFVPLV
jgi:hypothetical protein